MTIPKNAGLSRLAEAASPIEYYPVRRRGQKRRLIPNWDAIRWLEEDTEGATEISDVAPLGAENTPWHSINNVRALGYYSAKRTGHYPRRMFDVFDLEVSSSNMISYADPCPGCQDFSRSWACTEHPEVAWNTKRRVWERHIEDRTRCSCTPCTERRERAAEASNGYTDMGTDGLRPPQGLYDRLIEMFGGPLPQEAYQRQAAMYFTAPRDPNQGRPGHHYDFATDRWVPDTDDALADFRAGGEVGAGFFQGRPVTVNEVSADERMAAEWERQNGIPLADVLRQIDRVPDELITRRLGALPDASITLSGTFTLEITSDTTASAVQIEVERHDDTAP